MNEKKCDECGDVIHHNQQYARHASGAHVHTRCAPLYTLRLQAHAMEQRIGEGISHLSDERRANVEKCVVGLRQLVKFHGPDARYAIGLVSAQINTGTIPLEPTEESRIITPFKHYTRQ